MFYSTVGRGLWKITKTWNTNLSTPTVKDRGFQIRKFATMLLSEGTDMVIESYQRRAELLLKSYVLADSIIICTSVMIGIFACKLVYEHSRLISAVYFKSYLNLSRSQQTEWSNRAMSTFHAVYIATVSLYFIFWSDLFTDDLHRGPITLRSSTFSTFALGVSVGYFFSDLGMIIWCYPSLGGMEYAIHHSVSLAGMVYPMLTREGQQFPYMVLISEATTPFINLRWYLDAAGMKRSRAYIINGVLIFVAWLVTRILWFIYLFYHTYQYYDQVQQLHTIGSMLVLCIPVVVWVMNLMWFWKIFMGLKKTLAKRE